MTQSQHRPPDRPRELAYKILHQVETSGAFVKAALDGYLERHPLPPRDVGFVQKVCFCAARYQSTLDALIEALSRRKPESLDLPVHLLVRLGLAQLLYLSRVPAHAAVDETVESARRKTNAGGVGFVNAILRSAARALAPAGPEIAESKEPFLYAGEGRYWRLDLPRRPPLGRLALAFGLTDWAANQIAAQQGPVFDTLRGLCDEPPLTIRLNRRRGAAAEILERLRGEGLHLEPGATACTWRLSREANVARSVAFRGGYFSVQDETAYAVCEFLAPRPGESILDLCAAPGGKTCAMAEIVDCAARILACDVSPAKVALIEAGVKRLRLKNVEWQVSDGREARAELAGKWDAVLVDAPCTNSGVLSRRPDAAARLTRDETRSLGTLQDRLLENAWPCLSASPRARLVYSTCSVLPAENEKRIERFLATHPGARLDEARAVAPASGRHDGGFRARLMRRK